MARLVHYMKGFRPCTLYMMRRYYQVSFKKERDKSRLCLRRMTGLRLDKTVKVCENAGWKPPQSTSLEQVELLPSSHIMKGHAPARLWVCLSTRWGTAGLRQYAQSELLPTPSKSCSRNWCPELPGPTLLSGIFLVHILDNSLYCWGVHF